VTGDAKKAEGRRLLGQILKAQGVVKESQVQETLAEQKKRGGLFGQVAVQAGFASETQLARALAEQAGLQLVDLAAVQPEKAALALVDGSTAHAFGVLPLRVEGKTLVVAVSDPMNTAVLEDLRFTAGVDVRAVLGEP
jgi:type IV pilus assembly protein PilB